jgi:hypothetical protein
MGFIVEAREDRRSEKTGAIMTRCQGNQKRFTQTFQDFPNTLAYFDVRLIRFYHRDKTRVQMPGKIFPQLKVKCLAVYGPHSWF